MPIYTKDYKKGKFRLDVSAYDRDGWFIWLSEAYSFLLDFDFRGARDVEIAAFKKDNILGTGESVFQKQYTCEVDGNGTPKNALNQHLYPNGQTDWVFAARVINNDQYLIPSISQYDGQNAYPKDSQVWLEWQTPGGSVAVKLTAQP